MTNNENKEICSKCEGRCCKRAPGVFHPDDFAQGPMRETILAGLSAGLYQIDWWEADVPQYYLRPAIKERPGFFNGSWGGPCVLLDDNGCTISFESRPRGCRDLTPDTTFECGDHEHYDKEQAKDAWAACQIFQDIIKELKQ